MTPDFTVAHQNSKVKERLQKRRKEQSLKRLKQKLANSSSGYLRRETTKDLVLNVLKGNTCKNCKWYYTHANTSWCYMVGHKPTLDICKLWKEEKHANKY